MTQLRLTFKYSIPDILADKVQVSKPYQNYNARGTPTSFGIDLHFPEMELSKTLKSSDFHFLQGKIEDTMRSWEKKYRTHLDRQHRERRSFSVDEMNREAKEAIEALHGILSNALNVNHVVDWNAAKRRDPFRIDPEQLFESGRRPKFISFDKRGRPVGVDKQDPPIQPTIKKVKEEYGLLARVFRKRNIEADLNTRLEHWREQVEQTEKDNAARETQFRKAEATFRKMEKSFEEQKKRDNDVIAETKLRYEGGDSSVVEEYCDLVLSSSEYPDYFPKNWVLEYRPDNRMVVVAYDLPSPGRLPRVKSYKYVKTRDEVTEQKISAVERKRLYDEVMYKTCIRTIHELIQADQANAIDAVAFNGVVTSRNPATGIEETKIILSVLADKEKFVSFDLSQVDPKATFKHLKGIAAATLVDLTPIPPVIQLDKTDKRFIEGKMVAAHLDESVNLAAMNWEDFEHLIRELFEKEFTANGGEVRVTQASADGGVDAVAFDPDPIRGGKIVIQAKRYTNTVGVAAVRDLYGTVMNEGATKGILVTTSDYGKDSYEFAKDKPLTLLNGSNLLALLEKHGHKARINVAEAKKMLRE